MLDSLKNKTKFGFSLFEVVLTMSIVAIFVAACSNVFTQRHKKRILTPIHGHYECYMKDDGMVYERKFEGDVEVLSESLAIGDNPGERCQYTPPIGASYIVLVGVAGGGHGGSVFGGSSGGYTNIFISSTDHKLEIIPGAAAAGSEGSIEERGGTTRVIDKGATHDVNHEDKEIITLLGGMSNSSETIAFKDCQVAYAEHNCMIPPACELNEKWRNSSGQEVGAVEVSYCIKDMDELPSPKKPAIRNMTIPFVGTNIEDPQDDHWGLSGFSDKCHGVYSGWDDVGNLIGSVDNQWVNTFSDSQKSRNQYLDSIYQQMGAPETPEARQLLSEGLVTYYYNKYICDRMGGYVDAKYTTLFSLHLRLDGNYTEELEESAMDGYLNSLNLAGGIFEKDAAGRRESSGQGGAKEARGGNGSVLVLW